MKLDTIKIQAVNRTFQGAKRQDLPYIITLDCTCGEKIVHDFISRYLSYPTIPGENIVPLYCQHCGSEAQIKVRINITLELVQQYTASAVVSATEADHE
jgi:hypothetical protein